MLPTAKDYLARSGLSQASSAYMLIGLFLVGVIAISVFSHIAHRYIPSHVVDCTHSHEPHEHDPEHDGEEHYYPENGHPTYFHKDQDERGRAAENNERTPLLPRHSGDYPTRPTQKFTSKSTGLLRPRAFYRHSVERLLSSRVTRIFRITKDVCDETGPCYGFSQTCGTHCQKILGPKSSHLLNGEADPEIHARLESPPMIEPDPSLRTDEPDTPLTVRYVPIVAQDETELHRPANEQQGSDYFSQGIPPASSSSQIDEERTAAGSQESTVFISRSKSFDEHSNHSSLPHHHHVPQNAFLSIGLQTSLAIALHKLPEGFIAYATNHASPMLGTTVFIALFIHNITDGFALALPLFLAVRSRTRAIFWASLLGGISQPAGAGFAALWIWYTDHGRDATGGTSWGVYGGMFAATAGIMTSVGLQLFSEGLSLTHNPNICIFSAIIGMGILGVSFALTA